MSARKAQRSPRRKAGRIARKTKRKIVFRLVVEAQEMLVSYEPNWSGGEFPYGHFEFRSPHKPPRPILISETGYQSHFAPMAEIEAAANPECYAREFVLAVLDRGSKTRTAAAAAGQLSLF